MNNTKGDLVEMVKKCFSVISISLLVAILFTGCSNGKTTSTGSSNVTIVYNSMWNQSEPQGKVISDAVKAFKTKTGITVKVNFQGRDTRKTLQPALESGQQLDLFDEDLDRVNTNWAKYLYNMEDLASKSYDTTNGKAFISVINPKLISLARSLGPNGKLSTIPYQPSTFVVMYNKDIFKSAGITQAPKNWDEWLSDCAKIKAIGKTPITVDDAYMASLFGYHMARLIGQDKTMAMVTAKKIDNPAVLTFGEQWQKMYDNGYISKNAAGNIYPAGQQEVALGNVAMYLNGTWLPNEIKSSTPANFNWGSFAYPAIGSGGDGTNANQFGAQCFGINKDSKYAEAAFKFIVFMTTGTWDNKLASETIGVPMANDATWPKQLAEAKTVLDATTVRYSWAVGMENDSDINAEIKTNFALLVSGKLNAQGFADAMKK
jgi:raffinose/stachyose/melibiose transport system substrate-binding protein